MALGPDTRLTWYGHSCFQLVSPGGKTILFDPWFSNPRSPRPPDEVDRCDILLVSHGHFDHFDDAPGIARRTGPTWPAIHEIDLWLSHGAKAGDGTTVIGFNAGGTVDVDGIKVTMVPAIHSAGNWTVSAGNWTDQVDTALSLGEAVGFVVELEDGLRLYFAGDTTVFGDMRIIGELYQPRLALLPIGGHYTMGPREAALAVELLGVPEVVPMHYGTFPILAGTPAELRAHLEERGKGAVTVHELEPGAGLG
ncbi:MAG TPA: metal-dependent hydrolase [Candidatus Limnocylindrales bacterium]